MKESKNILNFVLLNEAIKYVDKNPERNINGLLLWAEKMAVLDRQKQQIRTVKDIMSDPNSGASKLVYNLFRTVNPEVRNRFLINLFVNATLVGIPKIEESETREGCNIPWAILMDPTAACNLKCTGCWAAEYDKTAFLSYEVLDRIITEGKEVGIHMYLYSGGEPLMRKNDIIKLAYKHQDCAFLSFTNATLIDEEFAKEVQRVGNLSFAISIEGFEIETDLRRGNGTYQKVLNAMDILKKYGIIYGFSTCYHRLNTEVIGSEGYIDFMLEKGCLFGWYFTYLPIGKNAHNSLLAMPAQRAYMYDQVRKFRQTKPIFLIDFWNDSEYVGGCIAGGRKYLHINANGDVEPCAFIHYSNTNIKDTSLLEALKQPLFIQYKNSQPFNENHLRPCPLLDNPHKLREMVNLSNAQSTHSVDEESVDELTEKCWEISNLWGKTADEMWKESNRAAYK